MNLLELEWNSDRDAKMSELAAHVRGAHFSELRGKGRRTGPNLDWRLGLLVLAVLALLCAWGMSEAKSRMDRDYAEGQEMSR